MSRKFFLFFAWGLLAVSSLFALTTPDVFRYTIFSLIPLLSILSIEHYKNNFHQALLLVLVSFAIGTAAEAYGLAGGAIFGARYEYTFRTWFQILNVPFQVGAFWAIFYYLAHVVTNTFLRSKRVLKLCLLDATLMTGIDLLLDPVMVNKGAWRWFSAGPFFGIPTGNFSGWFLVSLAISFIVRRILKIKISDKTNFALISLISTIFILLVVLFSP